MNMDRLSSSIKTPLPYNVHQPNIETTLEDIQKHYLLLAEHTTDIITKYKPDGIMTYASPAVKKQLGYTTDELVGRSIFPFLHPSDLPIVRRSLSQLMNHPSPRPICYRIKRKDGCYIWLETNNQVIIDRYTHAPKEIIAVSRDITDRKATEERLLYLANYDSLTGLPNRTLFKDRLRRAIIRAQRQKTQVALLFLDLDRFKNINDSLGHHAGDQLLREVAKRLKQQSNTTDTIARLGGDEFTIIRENVSNDDATTIAHHILQLMETPFKIEGHEVVISASIGITLFPDDGHDMHRLLKNADTAMYRSKDKGRNNYQLYTPAMNNQAYEFLLLENNLRHALERDEFELYFQPQIDLHTQDIIGVEALLRWQHPENGLILPDAFIPFAEEMGLIIPIGEWVLRQACLQARRWQEMGFHPIRVAVNLSMRQFKQKNFVDLVKQALTEASLDPECLELEITERFLAHNVQQATEVLYELHHLGVQLSVDDFGTGYSSLSYLKKFPLNTLKIDQSFIKQLTTDPDQATLTEAIIGLGQSLHLNVIAEGVESEEQVFFLRERGCDQVQGYLFSRPLPVLKFIQWLKENQPKYAPFKQWDLWPDTVQN